MTNNIPSNKWEWLLGTASQRLVTMARLQMAVPERLGKALRPFDVSCKHAGRVLQTALRTHFDAVSMLAAARPTPARVSRSGVLLRRGAVVSGCIADSAPRQTEESRCGHSPQFATADRAYSQIRKSRRLPVGEPKFPADKVRYATRARRRCFEDF